MRYRYLLVTASVFAPAVVPAAPATTPDGSTAPHRIECRCRANGQSYELGSRVCLRTPAGYRVAECRMVQNVTSWSFGREDCSVTALLSLRPATPGHR